MLPHQKRPREDLIRCLETRYLAHITQAETISRTQARTPDLVIRQHRGYYLKLTCLVIHGSFPWTEERKDGRWSPPSPFSTFASPKKRFALGEEPRVFALSVLDCNLQFSHQHTASSSYSCCVSALTGTTVTAFFTTSTWASGLSLLRSCTFLVV